LFNVGVVRVRLLSPSIAIIVLGAVTGTASSQEGPSLWDLNGSEMSLSANGAQRQFRYHTVRPGLQEAGVQPGTLWFQGTRSGDQYSGTAYVFSNTCGGLPYPVTGLVSPDGQTITIHGSAPIVTGDSCAVVDHRDTADALHLTHQATIARANGETKTYGDDGRLFCSGNDDYYLLSRQPESDEDATSYVGQVRVVHHFEGGGYEILMKDYSARCAAADKTFFVTWFKAGDESNPYTVRINNPHQRPASNKKESYNLYWAACYEQFRKFK
jgi:hypothetical protein